MNRNLSALFVSLVSLLVAGCQSYGPGEGRIAYGHNGHVAWEHPVRGLFPHTISHSPDKVILYNACHPGWHVDLYEADELVFKDMDSQPYTLYPDSPFINDYPGLAAQMYRLDGNGHKYAVQFLPAQLQVHSTGGWLSAQWVIGNGNSYLNPYYANHNF